LAEQQTEKSAVESQQDIETMIERIKRWNSGIDYCWKSILTLCNRSSAKELPKEVQERQDAVIACYK
jgi:hypothetical protein